MRLSFKKLTLLFNVCYVIYINYGCDCSCKLKNNITQTGSKLVNKLKTKGIKKDPNLYKKEDDVLIDKEGDEELKRNEEAEERIRKQKEEEQRLKIEEEERIRREKERIEEERRKAQYFPRANYVGCSIVVGLKSIGANSSYNYRCSIAARNGIGGYVGSPAQNTHMLDLLKNGTLLRP